MHSRTIVFAVAASISIASALPNATRAFAKQTTRSRAEILLSEAPTEAGSQASSNEELGTVLKSIEQLVHQSYPKAKIEVSATKMHCEFKCRNETGYYSGLSVLAPQEGGIVCDLTLESGKYNGADKDRLPSEVEDGFHTTLTVAPYSKQQDKYLLARLSFPPDLPAEFNDNFKAAVNAFNAKELAAEAAAEKAAAEKAAAEKAAAEKAASEKTAAGEQAAEQAAPNMAAKPTNDLSQGKAPTQDPPKTKPPTPPSISGYPASDFVVLKPCRYVPGYPTKVVILHSDVTHFGRTGNSFKISYFTPEPYKKAVDTWVKLLPKSGWHLPDPTFWPLLLPGQLKANIPIPTYHTDGSFAGLEVDAALTITSQPVQGGGTKVVVEYDEPDSQGYK